jgi:hypothetical protein
MGKRDRTSSAGFLARVDWLAPVLLALALLGGGCQGERQTARDGWYAPRGGTPGLLQQADWAHESLETGLRDFDTRLEIDLY